MPDGQGLSLACALADTSLFVCAGCMAVKQ